MIIHKLSPQGFCWGVRQAIQKVEQALMDPAIPNRFICSDRSFTIKR